MEFRIDGYFSESLSFSAPHAGHHRLSWPISSDPLQLIICFDLVLVVHSPAGFPDVPSVEKTKVKSEKRKGVTPGYEKKQQPVNMKDTKSSMNRKRHFFYIYFIYKQWRRTVLVVFVGPHQEAGPLTVQLHILHQVILHLNWSKPRTISKFFKRQALTEKVDKTKPWNIKWKNCNKRRLLMMLQRHLLDMDTLSHDGSCAPHTPQVKNVEKWFDKMLTPVHTWS